jgi:hypothetical protein
MKRAETAFVLHSLSGGKLRAMAQADEIEGLRPAKGSWQYDVEVASGLNALLGVCLIACPFVLGFSDEDPYWSDVIFGTLVFMFGLSRWAGFFRDTWISAANVVVGGWIFLSSFLLYDTGAGKWSNFLIGALIAMLAAWSAISSARPSSPTRVR